MHTITNLDSHVHTNTYAHTLKILRNTLIPMYPLSQPDTQSGRNSHINTLTSHTHTILTHTLTHNIFIPMHILSYTHCYTPSPCPHSDTHYTHHVHT